MAKTKKTMTHMQAIELSIKLKQVCETHQGYAKYAEGWDDDKVLKEMGDDYSIASVSRLRKSLFGDLPPKARKLSLQEIQERLEHLEEWAALRPVQGFKKQ